MDTKQWYLSKTLWGAVVSVVGLFLSMKGHSDAMDPATAAALPTQIVNAIAPVMILAGSVVAIIGRFVAQKPLK
jgi:hypothetical protein